MNLVPNDVEMTVTKNCVIYVKRHDLFHVGMEPMAILHVSRKERVNRIQYRMEIVADNGPYLELLPPFHRGWLMNNIISNKTARNKS